MYSLRKRVEKAEKQVGVGKIPHVVNIAGIEISRDEFLKLLNEIDGKSRGLPTEEEVNETRR